MEPQMMKTTLLFLIVAVLLLGVGAYFFLVRGRAHPGPLPELSSDLHTWTLSQDVNPASPRYLLRLNQTAKELQSHPDLPYQITLTVPILAPQPDGLPTPEEHDTLGAIEETAIRLFEKDGGSLSVAVVTTEGRKEFIFYTANRERTEAQVERLREAHPSHQIQFKVERDPGWRTYRDLLRLPKS